jgi:hypothetical protein
MRVNTNWRPADKAVAKARAEFLGLSLSAYLWLAVQAEIARAEQEPK